MRSQASHDLSASAHSPASWTSPRWRFGVLLLAMLSIAGPFIFGLPLTGWQSAVDGNFALSLTRGYMQSLHAGVWLPRWLPDANDGLGSPVFYFYGRLPFFIAAVTGVVLHLSPVAALIAGFFVFRIAAFFACRLWLRQHADAPAADCGALVFIALPFAMTFNPITRVAPAETAATALVPLILLVLDRISYHDSASSRSTQALAVAALGVLYAAIASMHPLHLMLGFAVTLLYAALLRGAAGALINILGFLLGLLLGASSILPAIAMLPWISPSGWTTGIPGVLLSNNFLFSAARYRVYRIHDIDLLLYSTWLLCAFVLLQSARAIRRQQVPLVSTTRRFARALHISLLLSLAAMTILAKPLWLLSDRLRLVQFPWRLFPEALAFTAALVALSLTRHARAQRLSIRLLLGVVLLQLTLPATGAWLSFSGIKNRRHLSDSILHRVPAYVPFSKRDQPPNNTENTVEPEYLPHTAYQAGWTTSPFKAAALPGLKAFGVTSTPSPTLHLASHPDGTFTVQGSVASPQQITLPIFYFPDERILGAPDNTLSLDSRTGLVRLALAPGPVAITLDHNRPLRILLLARALTLLGLLIIAAIVAFAILTRPALLRTVSRAPREPSMAARI